MKPRISIIIPHFERVELLQQTLQTIRSQSYSNWEAWIVDDGSSDETWATVSQLAEADRIHILQRNEGLKGPSTCRNIGAQHAHGEWLLFLDSDDLMAPWCLENRTAKIKENAADFLVFPVALFHEKIGDLDCLWNQLSNDAPDLNRFLTADSVWQTSSPLWCRKSFLKIGGFNERVFYGDDSDVHTRAILAGLTYRKFDQSLPDVFIRRSEQARITNSAIEKLVASRAIRLNEGADSLRKSNASPVLQLLWEGQYFIEAEFLLFNMNHADMAIADTLQSMQANYNLSLARRLIIRTYFRIALRCKAKAYIILRLARRVAVQLLPPSYFATPASDSARRMSNGIRQAIQEQLEQYQAAAAAQDKRER
ncbi:glycosyltransferase family 2 protein [Cerasicoccus arenae]|uniref:Glycosyltransferase 2-like domain-containing protein n=1 Tax=Cerasicoccus arenae TaxID=424488 RepID=A0A8J3DF92_9BACT|nr:glycosyltransferase [Cerasicoccus arenae]MBK1857044.1 glycosyltransferase [Cerasicoccus arenae]GHB92039.1 hypothetical protein GCM10007047_03780 [Cerasicoccus arenae]